MLAIGVALHLRRKPGVTPRPAPLCRESALPATYSSLAHAASSVGKRSQRGGYPLREQSSSRLIDELDVRIEKDIDVRSLGNLLARVVRALFHTPYYTVRRFAMSRRLPQFVKKVANAPDLDRPSPMSIWSPTAHLKQSRLIVPADRFLDDGRCRRAYGSASVVKHLGL